MEQGILVGMEPRASDPFDAAGDAPPRAQPVPCPARSAEAVGTSRPAGHRLGPLLTLTPLAHPLWGRCYAAALVLMMTGVLAVAWSLAPAGRHLGTHRQLGLPPCGFLTMTGLPCPTCGMTTAFAFMARGHVLAAVRAQPMGALLALATWLTGLISAVALITGRYTALNWYRVNPTHLVWWVALAFILAWAATIALGLLDGTLPVRHAFPG